MKTKTARAMLQPSGAVSIWTFLAFMSSMATAGNFLESSVLTIEQIREKAKTGDVEAILDLGSRHDKGAAEILERIAKGPKPTGLRDSKTTWAARCALAKIGKPEYLEEIIAGLNRRNRIERAEFIAALGWIGDRNAARFIGPILLEKGGPSNSGKKTWAGLASEAMGGIFPNVQANLMMKQPDNPDRVEQWRRWWLKVKDRDPSRYDNTEGDHAGYPQECCGFRKLFR